MKKRFDIFDYVKNEKKNSPKKKIGMQNNFQKNQMEELLRKRLNGTSNWRNTN